MNPTQLELATIAATLPTGTPVERVETALAIFDEAEAALLARTQNLRPLEELLAELMPKKDKGEREKKWREFLPWHEQNRFVEALRGNPFRPSNSLSMVALQEESRPIGQREERVAQNTMIEHRKSGVKNADKVADHFRVWVEEQAAINRHKKAQKGGLARHEQKKVPETEKNSCVDTLPVKQAKNSPKLESEPAKLTRTWRKR